MSEQPGRSLHPISETDEEMTTRSRALEPSLENHQSSHGGTKSSSVSLLSLRSHISHTRGKRRNKRKSVKEKRIFLVFESDSHTLHTTHYTPT